MSGTDAGVVVGFVDAARLPGLAAAAAVLLAILLLYLKALTASYSYSIYMMLRNAMTSAEGDAGTGERERRSSSGIRERQQGTDAWLEAEGTDV